jgi:NAD(P)-dependent dehydrogenase (short-subunit alcohol dehydrogenase family)
VLRGQRSKSISWFFSGIGLESSLLFAAEGANVILADINLAAADRAAGFIASQSPDVRAIAFKVDIGKENEVKALVDKAVETFGRLDVMVSSQSQFSIRSGHPIDM